MSAWIFEPGHTAAEFGASRQTEIRDGGVVVTSEIDPGLGVEVMPPDDLRRTGAIDCYGSD
jgi:hypothetical protein